jgi:uncharacterized protein (UPF0548 family)
MTTAFTTQNTLLRKRPGGETLFPGATMNVFEGRIVRKAAARVSKRQAIPVRLSVCLVKEQAGRSNTARPLFFAYVHE